MISMTKVEQQAPGLVSLAKTAAVSLEKQGLSGQRAAVQLVLDHSGSMHPYYANGAVQRLAEQALGLSVNLDDDGSVPLVFFGSYVEQHDDIRLDNYAGLVDHLHQRVHWGSTNYVAGMQAAIAEYRNSGATDPALVIFQTDGEPNDRRAAEKALREASSLPMFWAFVGFGGRVDFLEKLDDLGRRTVDNASFFHAANPHAVTDAQLYDGITGEFAQWLTAARAAGILR
ncbi:VWA domain-containing protein [Streptomyces sp. AMCC400023]|uniref:VWA domain-containing protein n=1 Tax=Streptomyces sp. AMCC400023 TaxID=2056258 RepID=UPI001F32DACA|nr:VWA domain-containing protein [Streptomyces sp. AMCC400023]UJV42034.1 toxic cation resistance protein [Streptomyces sp. AMCC400023]